MMAGTKIQICVYSRSWTMELLYSAMILCMLAYILPRISNIETMNSSYFTCVSSPISDTIITYLCVLEKAVYNHWTGLDWISGLPLELEFQHYTSILRHTDAK